jgi:hypothetical protein
MWFEQNMKAFADMQGRVLGPMGSGPMANPMGAYFEQSRRLFEQMGFTLPKK